jgi:putative FmdB family regulatory protein
MPLYDIACRCGETRTIFRRIAEIDNLPTCTCGGKYERRISAPMVLKEFTPFQSPATGKWIESREAHRADLKASGSFLYEKGVEKDIARNKQYTEEKTFAPIAAAVDNTVRELVNSGKIESV